MNLAYNLERSTYFFPDRPAVRQDGMELTYRQLNEQANRIAAGLCRMGVKPGDFIGLCSPNSAEWISFYFGVLKTGAVAVTLSGILTGDELALLVNHSRPRFIYIDASKLETVKLLRTSAGIEKIICPGGDLTVSDLMDKESGTFRDRGPGPSERRPLFFIPGALPAIPKGVMLTS